MTKQDFIDITENCNSYIDNLIEQFPLIRDNLLLKKVHSEHVAENARLVSCDLNLSKSDELLARTAAVLHDIGRFKQFIKFGTFNDNVSINHAVFGISEIKYLEILQGLCPESQQLIYKTIELHNALHLPEDLDEQTSLQVKILRDADKLDILRVVVEHYENPDQESNRYIQLDLPDLPAATEKVITAIKNRSLVRFGDINSLNDFKLLQISWVFDINYSWTKRQIIDREYIGRIFNNLNEIPVISELKDTVFTYLNALEAV